MPLYTHETLPATSAEAIEVFDERFLMLELQGPVPTWATEFGGMVIDDSPATTFPMAYFNVQFKESKGENRFTGVAEDSFTLNVVEYDTGIEADALQLRLNVYAYAKWKSGADKIRNAEARFRGKQVSAMLEANTALTGWDKLALFHDAHKANPKDESAGTFDNLQASAKTVLDVDNIAEEITEFMKVKDTDGSILGVEATHIMVPTSLFHSLQNLLKQDFIANAAGTATIRNPYNGSILTVVHNPDLTNQLDWYIIDANLIAAGFEPWLIKQLDPGPALGLRIYDEASDFFKNSGHIAISRHIWYGFGVVYPHAIRKVVGAAP